MQDPIFKPINGYTKASILAKINSSFQGKAQEVFKGDAAEELAGSCLYRMKDGRRCAVGLFIPDSVETLKSGGFNITIESFKGSATALLSNNPGLREVMPLDVIALNAFQNVHDHMDRTLAIDEQKAVLCAWVNENVVDDAQVQA